MRADRLLSLVLLLRNRGRMTAAALARELEVSTRTVQRDVDALSAAGIPVYADRGRDGGYALLAGFSTDLTGLTPDEAVALLTARSQATSDALGLGPAFASAMRKVIAAIPATTRPNATTAADRVLVRPGGWLADPTPEPALPALQHAVFTARRLRLRYRPAEPPGSPPPKGAPTWRTVDPIGLVSAAGRWYLLALRNGQDRTYRVSRITEAVELDEPAHRPNDVDLEALWHRRRTEFRSARARLTVRTRIRPTRHPHLANAALTLTPVPTKDPTWLTFDAEFGDLQHAESALWTLAPHAEALSPPELRAALAARATQVMTAHT
ncbi:helix-turn-helix transcriptional regulator [Pseudonocardia acaciae]|uniref:helix-turn-helix transcriptional regulator n=1 Tax=Pseudonocardia acaciae TaxID=551276 RepID=UPI00048E23E3|nr:WYL domain-containing protein [Pseudonocardia acaciae]